LIHLRREAPILRERIGDVQGVEALTRGARPGLCPSNAEKFLRPFGPPVVQVSSEEKRWLDDVASLITWITARESMKFLRLSNFKSWKGLKKRASEEGPRAARI
jgi:hypothetical protein